MSICICSAILYFEYEALIPLLGDNVRRMTVGRSGCAVAPVNMIGQDEIPIGYEIAGNRRYHLIVATPAEGGSTRIAAHNMPLPGSLRCRLTGNYASIMLQHRPHAMNRHVSIVFGTPHMAFDYLQRLNIPI